MRKIALPLLLASAVWIAPALAYFSNTWFEGAGGWRTAARHSRAAGVPMLVYFRVDWCPHCRSFDEMLDESAVRARLATVIKVVVDPEDGEEEQRLFREAYGATGFPTVFLHPPEGSPRRISHGGPPERFLAQLSE